MDDLNKQFDSQLLTSNTMSSFLTSENQIRNNCIFLIKCKNEECFPIKFVSQDIKYLGYNAESFIFKKSFLSELFPKSEMSYFKMVLNKNINEHEKSFFCELKMFDFNKLLKNVITKTTVIYEKSTGTEFETIIVDITQDKHSNINYSKIMCFLNSDKLMLIQHKLDQNDNYFTNYISQNIKYFGYSINTFLDGNCIFWDIINSDDKIKILSEIKNCNQNEVRSFNSIIRIIKPDNNMVWSICKISVHKNNDFVTLIEMIIQIFSDNDSTVKLIQEQNQLTTSLSQNRFIVITSYSIHYTKLYEILFT